MALNSTPSYYYYYYIIYIGSLNTHQLSADVDTHVYTHVYTHKLDHLRTVRRVALLLMMVMVLVLVLAMAMAMVMVTTTTTTTTMTYVLSAKLWQQVKWWLPADDRAVAAITNMP